MYIHDTLYKNPINPNIVSGADYDNSFYSNYNGDQDELLSLSSVISEKIAEVTEAKKELVEVGMNYGSVKEELRVTQMSLAKLDTPQLNSRALAIRRISEEGAKESAEFFAKVNNKKAQIEVLQKEHNLLRHELENLEHYINSRLEGSIPAYKKQFSDISGKDWTPSFSESDFLPEPFEPELIGGGINPNGMYTNGNGNLSEETIIDKISKTIGTTNQNTKYGLIGLGVVGILLIIKKIK